MFKNFAAFAAITVSTLSFAQARDAKINMRKPYDSAKIPVLFVHGLWDTKETWLPMLHALERDAQLSSKYQFWTFEYDTYMPFWIGAAELRSELDRIAKEHPKHKKIVLVGHSMGGLISRMVLTDYGGPRRTDVQRAIFIAAPHRGSDWGKLAFTPALAGLSPNEAAYQTLNRMPMSKNVPFHLIIGRYDELVDYESAWIEGAQSEKVVNTMHAAHWTQQGINEVKRILTEEVK
jgi:triacylglycerol esterase/lipase EstA (alpha/beta hydrolase family)